MNNLEENFEMDYEDENEDLEIDPIEYARRESFEDERLRAIKNLEMTCPMCREEIKVNEIFFVNKVIPDENLNKPSCPICYEQFYPAYGIKLNCCKRFVHVFCLRDMYASIYNCKFNIIDYNYFYQFEPSNLLLDMNHDQLLYNAELKINNLQNQINLLNNDLFGLESIYNYTKDNLEELKICYQESFNNNQLLAEENNLINNYNILLLGEIENYKMMQNDKNVIL